MRGEGGGFGRAHDLAAIIFFFNQSEMKILFISGKKIVGQLRVGNFGCHNVHKMTDKCLTEGASLL